MFCWSHKLIEFGRGLHKGANNSRQGSREPSWRLLTMHHKYVLVSKKERKEAVLTNFSLCLIGQSCGNTISQLRGRQGNEVFSFYSLCCRDRQGRRRWEMELGRPNKVHCTLPGHLMTITTFSLPVFPILRVN